MFSISYIYHFIGNLFNNYAIFILLVIIIGRLISIPCDSVRKKLNAEKKERDAVYAEIQKKTNSEKDKITNEIYNYYKKSNFKPWKLVFTNVIIFLVNTIILISILACFKPLTNFSNIPKNEVKEIISIYQNNVDTKRYPEITILSDIDKISNILKNNNISNKQINEILSVKNKFMIGKLDTTVIPKTSNETNVKIFPITFIGLCVLQNLISIVNILCKKNKNKKLIIINLISLIFTLLVTISIIRTTPVIVCFYLMIIYMYGIIRKIISILKDKRRISIEKTNSTNC